MKSNLARVLGLGAGVLALSACSPLPTSPGYTVSFQSDAFEADPVPMSFQVKATVEGGFTLGESACDPSLVSVDAEHATLVAEWDPYACTTEDALPTDPAHGNIQYFVDGIYMGTYYTDTVDVDLAPKGDSTDIKMMFYTTVDYDGDGVPDSLDGDSKPDFLSICNIYLPGDNMGLAYTAYDGLMRQGYMASEQVFDDGVGGYLEGGSVYDFATNDEILEADQAPLWDGFLGLIGYFPWTLFEHYGVNLDEDAVSGQNNGEQHILYGELHYDNHQPVYGAGRARTITKGFDLSGMPEDWCSTRLPELFPDYYPSTMPGNPAFW